MTPNCQGIIDGVENWLRSVDWLCYNCPDRLYHVLDHSQGWTEADEKWTSRKNDAFICNSFLLKLTCFSSNLLSASTLIQVSMTHACTQWKSPTQHSFYNIFPESLLLILSFSASGIRCFVPDSNKTQKVCILHLPVTDLSVHWLKS